MPFGHGLESLEPYREGLLGAPDQLISVERFLRDEVVGHASPVLMVRNPRGFSFEILLDRGLDVGWAQGPSGTIAWRSPRGFVEAARHEPEGLGWLRTFGGGLLSTCGLASTGLPSISEGVAHGLHGRIGHCPADAVRWEVVCAARVQGLTEEAGIIGPSPTIDAGDWIRVIGEVVESGLGGPTLRLTRQLLARIDSPQLLVLDRVTNESWQSAGHMFRHHLNLGYPLVTAGTRVHTTARPSGTRDHGTSRIPGNPWTLDLDPSATRGEEVVYCDNSERSVASVSVLTEGAGECRIDYDPRAFPYLILWRDPSAGVNALGVEPSTSRDDGRVATTEQGDLIRLAPLESRTYWTAITYQEK